MVFISVFVLDVYVNSLRLEISFSSLIPKVPEVSHQKVPEEEQPARLAASRGQHQGELRAALLPDQPGRGGRGRGLNSCCSFVK